MKKLIFLLSAALVFNYQSSVAQTNSDDIVPPNAEPGKCYAKCLKPDVFETVTERVMIQPEKKSFRIIPTTYKIITEQVMVKAESKRLEIVPAIYEYNVEQVKIKDETKRIITTPASYKTVTEQVLIKPEGQKWAKKKQTGCLSDNPDDCIIMCLEKTPAEYKTVTKQVLDQPASNREEVIPAEFKTVTKQVVKTPATTREITIPAEFKNVTKQVVDVAAHTEDISVPAQYTDVAKKVLKTKGGYSEWKEILCDNKVNSQVVKQIQDALTKKGYSVGPRGSDNVLGLDTRTALVKYQKDNHLPVGNLNLETLKSLGVKYED
ncbi:MAG: hypothetical protein RJA07_1045 [Bacteroidota bacterium]|jgi:hypothetical protein